MVQYPHIQNCPEPRMADILATISNDPASASEVASRAVEEFPTDANLRFLLGSAFGNIQDYGSAKSQLNEALALAPEFHLARLQLGLMHLTSGDERLARAILAPLLNIATDSYLRSFADGLIALSYDEFERARSSLQTGVSQNLDNAPLNRNMQLLINAVPAPQENEAMIETPHLLVQKYSKPPRP